MDGDVENFQLLTMILYFRKIFWPWKFFLSGNLPLQTSRFSYDKLYFLVCTWKFAKNYYDIYCTEHLFKSY
jgi:hypothetical protein